MANLLLSPDRFRPSHLHSFSKYPFLPFIFAKGYWDKEREVFVEEGVEAEGQGLHAVFWLHFYDIQAFLFMRDWTKNFGSNKDFINFNGIDNAELTCSRFSILFFGV